MIAKGKDKEFEKFQSFLKDIGYKKNPKTPEECEWVCDSYELFQGHVKGKYLFAPDELACSQRQNQRIGRR